MLQPLTPQSLYLYEDLALPGGLPLNVGLAYLLCGTVAPQPTTVRELRRLHYSADEGGVRNPYRPVIAVMVPERRTPVVIENNVLIHQGASNQHAALYILPPETFPRLQTTADALALYHAPHLPGAAYSVAYDIGHRSGWHNLYWLQAHPNRLTLERGLEELLTIALGISQPLWKRVQPQIARFPDKDSLMLQLSDERDGAPYTSNLIVSHQSQIVSREVN